MSTALPSGSGPGPSEPGLPSAGLDHALLRAIRAGDQEAAATLYHRYSERLRSLVERNYASFLHRYLDAEDIVQSVFRRFFDAVHAGKYDSPTQQELWDLLLVIALNRLRSEAAFQRAAKRDARRCISLNQDGGALEVEAKDGAATAQFLELAVREAIATLPADFQQVILLRMDGHEVADIATQMQRPKRTVERILRAARLRLECLLDEEESDDHELRGQQGP
jgi:RNA polymerase sigma-70 factor (ECF subfamily)